MDIKSIFKMGIVFSAINRTGNAFGNINRNVDGLSSRMSRLRSSWSSLLSIESAGMVLATSRFLKAGSMLEQRRVRFAVMTGDKSKGDMLINQIQQYAQATSYSNNELSKATQTMLGFGK